MILDSYKDLARFRRQQDKGQWAPRMPRELAGSKALIIGYGSIGRAVEKRLLPFGVEETGVARRQRPGAHGIEASTSSCPKPTS